MNIRMIGFVILFPFLQACAPFVKNNKADVQSPVQSLELSKIDFVSYAKFRTVETGGLNINKYDYLKIYPYRSVSAEVQPQLSLYYFFSFVLEEYDVWGWTGNKTGRSCNAEATESNASPFLDSLKEIQFQPYDTGNEIRSIADGPGPDLSVIYLDGKSEGIYFSDSWVSTGDLIALPSQALEVLRAELDKMVTSGCEYPVP